MTQAYRPYGAALKMLLAKEREVLLHGPAGTGKSMAALMKLYICAEEWPGMRGFIGRKYRASLTDTALVTWEERVLPPGHPCLRGPQREQRHIYRFPNGSTITVIGLDDAEKRKSFEADMGFFQEATELEEADLTPVVRAMRYGVMPWQQLLFDCNPGDPYHWLRRRFNIQGEEEESRADGRVAFRSHHEDNPDLYDHDDAGNATTITERGRVYLDELDKIPNRADRLRLRYGIWAGAEGRVYDAWDPTRHVEKPFPIPAWWPRYLGLDFGGANTAALFYALDPETDVLHLYREYHAGGRTARQHVLALLAGEAETPFCVGGAKGEGQWRAEFTDAGLRVHPPAIKDVALGIARVNGQHKRDGIKVFDTCTGYLEQKSSYRYLEDAADPEAIERKRHFHFCFVAGTMVETSCGPKPIEKLNRGDLVLTREGYCQIDTPLARENQPVRRLSFSDGTVLIGTPDHPIWVEGRGFVPIDALRYGDRILTKEDCWPCSQKPASTTALRTTAIRKISAARTAFTSRGRGSTSIASFGKSITARFLPAITSTIETAIPAIMRLRIWNASRLTTISARIIATSPVSGSSSSTSTAVPKQPTGISPLMGTCGTSGTRRSSTPRWNPRSEPANTAGSRTPSSGIGALTASAPTAARRLLATPAAWTMRIARALSVAARSRSTSTPASGSARVHVVSATATGNDFVYNLSVRDVHEYFANGVLVSNCDAERYIVGYLRPETSVRPLVGGRKGVARAAVMEL